MKLTIAVDGPAGAGKSTIAKAIAKELGILYLDTGAMYRAAAIKAIRLGILPSEKEKVIEMLKSTSVTVKSENGVQHTFLDGEDVSDKIRTQEAAKGASDYSVIKEVRIKLAQEQRDYASENSVIMDGREIGSFVLPNADYKFYVTASVEERAKRRLLELSAKGADAGRTQTDIEREIAARDKTDSTREFAPLIKTDDAILIDTTHMTADEAVKLMLSYIRS